MNEQEVTKKALQVLGKKKLHRITKDSIRCLYDEGFNRNRVNVLLDLMRGGKTWAACNEIAKIHLEVLDKKTVLITAPTTEITDDQIEELGKGFIGNQITTSPSEAIRRWRNGEKQVIVWSCAMAWNSSNRGIEIIEEIYEDKDLLVIMDEIHMGGTPHWEILDYDKGYKTDKFGAALFKAVSILETPYKFGLTATETPLMGVPHNYGEMEFKVMNVRRSPAELSHILGWIDKEPLFSSDRDLLISSAVKDSIERTKKTGIKCCTFIRCEVKNKDDKRYTYQKVTEKIRESLPREYDGRYVIAVMTGDKKYFVTGAGDKIKVEDDTEIKNALRDQNNPCLFLVCIEKGKMGLTVEGIKNIVEIRISETANPDGKTIPMTKLQVMGRGLTPNCGMMVGELYSKYNGNLSNIDFDHDANKMKFYLADTQTNRDVWQLFKEKFAPTYNEYKIQSERHADGLCECPICGNTHGSNSVELTTERLNEEFGI